MPLQLHIPATRTCWFLHLSALPFSCVRHFFTFSALLCSLLSLLILLYNSIFSSCTFHVVSICYNFGHAPGAVPFPPNALLCPLLHFRAPTYCTSVSLLYAPIPSCYTSAAPYPRYVSKIVLISKLLFKYTWASSKVV